MIDNWSVCDSFCASWKVNNQDAGTIYGYFASQIGTEDEFRMRMSLVFRIDHFMDDAHVCDILDDIAGYRNDGTYYIMGAAWALSVCYAKYPEMTEPFLSADGLDDRIRNRAIQKIRESYRVADDAKERVRKYRRG